MSLAQDLPPNPNGLPDPPVRTTIRSPGPRPPWPTLAKMTGTRDPSEVPDSPPTAAPMPTASAFTEERMLQPKQTPPAGGWRRIIYRASFGLVRPAPSAAELQRRRLVARAELPVTGSRRIAVLSRKGGVGKTTTALMLGHTFASVRGDRVVALDGNPDAGSLAYRVPRETTATVTDFLGQREQLDRYADVREFTSQAATRLEVVASDNDPRISQALNDEDYRAAISLLDRHYTLILLDTGTGILDSATQGILEETDQIVLVVPPALDGARVAASTLDWLDQHGHAGLACRAVVALNGVRPNGAVDLNQVEEHFAERCAAVISIGWDPHLESGTTSGLDELRPTTRHAYLELAAAVADGFATTVRREPVNAATAEGMHHV